MAKSRVHQVAKELGLETKDLIVRLDKMGIRDKRAQSSLDQAEVEQARTAVVDATKPHINLGVERVVADRVVTQEDQVFGEVKAHEKVVERRVRADVIRRRTSRTEIAPEPSAPSAEMGVPSALDLELPPVPEEEEVAPQTDVESEGVSTLPPEALVEKDKPADEVSIESPLRGPKVLGRIDLKRDTRVEAKEAPKAPEVEVKSDSPAVERPVERKRGEEDGEQAVAAAGEKERTGKGVRSKKRVVKKEEVFDAREREFRSGRGRGRVPRKKRALPGKEQRKTEITVPKASKRVVKVSDMVNVGDLARNMGVKTGDVIKKLMDLGMMATINKVLDADTATLIASEFGYQVENTAFDAETALEVRHEGEGEDTPGQPRPPVVTIMGHVDHGKTSLLDVIRQTNVTEQEAGGITQHIGAYHVEVHGRGVTFLDTPGHEAFTAMRARGAKVTDVVVLVVAADDGVMPQTVEAINHARAAGVPIIVAMNKIDRPDTNSDRVKRGLAENGLVPEDWGGDTIVVPVSALTKEGIPQLLEMLLLQADVLELKAKPDKLARGVVVEAKLDRGRGPVATVLVQDGTLRVGDTVVAGVYYGKIRAMIDDRGRKIEQASPSFPVEIQGLPGVSQSGESLVVLADEAKARQIAEHRHHRQREAELGKVSRVSLEEFYKQTKSGGAKELRVVLKGDVHGSVEALTDAMKRLSTEEVKVAVIHSGVGGATETDVLLATASNAVVIGFNVRPEPKASHLATQEEVEIRLYTVIYDALADIKGAMEGLLEPTFKEELHGRAQVREVFNVRGVGTVAGCYVTDGKIQRSSLVRLLRDQVVVHKGKLASLKRFKDDVREVASGYECGLAIDGFQDVKPGDTIEAFTQVQVARHLDSPVPAPEASQVSALEER